MVDPTLQAVIKQIHDSAHKLVFEFTGAGSLALFELHSVAGSSRTILEATDRYAANSMVDLLGHAPEQFVSRATAIAMAAQAYRRAMRLAEPGTACLGVACTAAIATDRVRRGEDRCWIAVRDHVGVTSYGLVMIKAARDRLGEEQVVSRLLLQAIAKACGIEATVSLGTLDGEQVEIAREMADDPIARLLDGSARTVLVAPDGTPAADQPVAGEWFYACKGHGE